MRTLILLACAALIVGCKDGADAPPVAGTKGPAAEKAKPQVNDMAWWTNRDPNLPPPPHGTVVAKDVWETYHIGWGDPRQMRSLLMHLDQASPTYRRFIELAILGQSDRVTGIKRFVPQ